ncbi:MAG: D-aminoacylase [Armatimonadaceae bacterium]
MAKSVLIKNGIVVDGSGARGRRRDVRLEGDTITQVGDNLSSADTVIEARGRVVAPGFIDTHSHADGGLLENPDAETQIRQGITTAIVGQDGGSNFPLNEWFDRLQRTRTTLNIASFVGHGTVRGKVLGEDSRRKATPAEVRKMQMLVADEMKAGALGLSSGLEYDPGLYADTAELVALAKVAGMYGGLYISHVRDEENDAFVAFEELVQVAQEARLPAQISHIKLALAPVWEKAQDVFRLMDRAQKRGLDITADVYPYTYWQSGIIVLMPPEYAMRGKGPEKNWEDQPGWERAIREVGGAENIRVTGYAPNTAWQGQTIAALAQKEKKDPVTLIQEMVTKTSGSVGVVVTAMQERDLKAFIQHPRIMFCSDGGLRTAHPRGAGSFPRILGKYVREEKVIPLEEAIRKMTSFPAQRMGLRDRGLIAPGKKADLVIFDPRTIQDTATVSDSRSVPIGLTEVIVNGTLVLRDNRLTGERPGQVLRRSG